MAEEKTQKIEKLSGFYRGKVLAHSDHGKCKIFWYQASPPKFENKPECLPDSEQAAPLFMHGSSVDQDANGLFFYPEIESTVWGFFENGDVNHPVYFAATKIESESNKDRFTKIKEKKQSGQLNVATDNGTLTITINRDNELLTIENKATSSEGILSERKNSSIVLYKDGSISISSPNGKVSIDAMDVSINATGSLSLSSGAISRLSSGGIAAVVGTGSAYLGAKNVLVKGSHESALYL